MKSFAIDLYIWHADLNDWLWVPARGARLRWPGFPGISQAMLLSSTAGVTFRVDDVFWLGNERDPFPLEMAAYELSNTVGRGKPSESLTRLATDEFLSLQIRESLDGQHVLLSRTSTRDVPNDYLEETARHVGTYYEDFAVEAKLWKTAVNMALGGLTDALITSPLPGPGPEHEGLARWLLNNYGPANPPA